MPMLRTTLAILIMGTFCMMLVGCPGCARKKPVLRPKTTHTNPDVTSGLDGINAMQFRGGYTFVIPLTDDRVFSATADSGAVTRENGLQVFHLNTVTCQVYSRGVVAMRMSGDNAIATRMDKSTLNTTLNGHVMVMETVRNQQAQANALQWNTNETIVHLDTFYLTGLNAAGEQFSLRAPKGTVTTSFSEIHWTGRGTMEMIGGTGKR